MWTERQKLLRRGVSLLAIGLMVGCEAGSFEPPLPGQHPSLRVYADVSSTLVTGLTVEISAPDIDPALVYNLPVEQGVATGTVEVPAGSHRAFTLRAYDGGGAETHRGSRTIDVLEQDNPPLEIVLAPVQGTQEISATLGSVIVVVSPARDTTRVGETVQLSAAVIDSVGDAVPDASVNWASLAPEFAEVDSQGRVRGVESGDARIVATYGFVGGSAMIHVVADSDPALGVIQISPSSSTLYEIGGTVSLSAAATDADGAAITDPGIEWASLNPSIATVDQMGTVTSQAFGTAVITASAACCAPDSAIVEVRDTTSVNLPEANLFIDGFESASFDAKDPNGINVDGFSWGKPNATSIVRDDGCVVNNGSAIENCGFESREWENAPDGTGGRHSLRFRYAAGADNSEQRYDLGAARRDLWFRYWVRVPINYYHIDGSGARNQKFFAVWMDGYSQNGDGSTVWWGFNPTTDGGSNWWWAYSDGAYTASGSQEQKYADFIVVPRDLGRWMQVVLHVKAESSPGADDGVIQAWRRWEDETGFTKIHETFTAGISLPSGGSPDGFRDGYVMGWANSPYAEDTEFLVDRFEVSTEPLVPQEDL